MQPLILSEDQQKKLFHWITFIIILIVLLNTFATSFYLYSTLWWFDIPMHFLGGVFTALLSLWFFVRVVPARFLPNTLWGWVITVLLSVFIVGLAWEMYELIVDLITGAGDYVYLDAFSDLWNDLAGGCFSLVCFISRIKGGNI